MDPICSERITICYFSILRHIGVPLAVVLFILGIAGHAILRHFESTAHLRTATAASNATASDSDAPAPIDPDSVEEFCDFGFEIPDLRNQASYTYLVPLAERVLRERANYLDLGRRIHEVGIRLVATSLGATLLALVLFPLLFRRKHKSVSVIDVLHPQPNRGSGSNGTTIW